MTKEAIKFKTVTDIEVPIELVDEQVEAFRELRNTAEKLGIPVNEFIDNLDEINGRWLLINSFKNVGQALIKVFKAIGGAWRRIFDPVQSDQIFNIIAAIHKCTASLIPTDRQAALLTKTFKVYKKYEKLLDFLDKMI